MKNKVCSFFGHRNIILNDECLSKLKQIIEDLIIDCNVNCFLFGSKSNFDDICHKIIDKLKIKYPYIIRKCYTCSSESCLLERDRDYWENIYNSQHAIEKNLLFVDEEIEFNKKYNSNRASYIERNQSMIDDSDYCVFYFNENYKPELRKYSKKDIGYYQPNSGTAIAYKYAKQKKKIIINLCDIQI